MLTGSGRREFRDGKIPGDTSSDRARYFGTLDVYAAAPRDDIDTERYPWAMPQGPLLGINPLAKWIDGDISHFCSPRS